MGCQITLVGAVQSGVVQDFEKKDAAVIETLVRNCAFSVLFWARGKESFSRAANSHFCSTGMIVETGEKFETS